MPIEHLLEPHTPVEGTESAEIMQADKEADKLYNKLRHEIIAGDHNLAAFGDWVDERAAEAVSFQDQVNYDLTSDFAVGEGGRAKALVLRTRQRLDPQFSLDRSVIRSSRRKLKKVKKKIASNPDFNYHLGIDRLQSRYGWPLYSVEMARLTARQQEPPTMRTEIALQAQALHAVAANVGRIRETLVRPAR